MPMGWLRQKMGLLPILKREYNFSPSLSLDLREIIFFGQFPPKIGKQSLAKAKPRFKPHSHLHSKSMIAHHY